MSLNVKDVAYQLHHSEGDHTAVFELSDQDQSSSATQYFGYVDLNARFIIMERVFSSGVTTVRYVYGRTGYTTAWTNRASLSYDYYYELNEGL